MIYIVMGVSGCGKTTVGSLLSNRLQLPFFDADDFHPISNLQKMQNGQPLTDEDRQDWLEYLGQKIRLWNEKGGAVLACSALKEKYRERLQTIPPGQISWIFLNGDEGLISERLLNRENHFMAPCLLPSQLETLEPPDYALAVNIAASPNDIVQEILNSMKNKKTTSAFGFIGMGVMGKSLALNLAGKNVNVAIYNRHVPGREEGIAQKVIAENPELRNLRAFDDLKEFVQNLERPRKIFLMIMAGDPVDSQIAELIPLLEAGDVILDGGNSFYKDTARRTAYLAGKGIQFVGTGVSGGEEGARNGPAIMPGGSAQGYDLSAEFLDLLAAKDKNGRPCCTYIGPGGAGHFVKMVHNGIEYAEMQLLAETYTLMRFGLQMDPPEMVKVLKEWQGSDLNNFLLGITIDILQVYEKDELLLDKVLDQAAQKGTGGWSINAALEYGAPFSLIAEAVMARAISAQKPKRMVTASLYDHHFQPIGSDKGDFLVKLKSAYRAARILNHEAGFSMMQQAAEEEKWDLNLNEIARIWTNGCIIRSELMEELAEVLSSETDLLVDPGIIEKLKTEQTALVAVVSIGLQHGIALPVFSAAINHFLSRITGNSGANLLQAQRDAFGSHTFQRLDAGADQHFHANWKPGSASAGDPKG